MRSVLFPHFLPAPVFLFNRRCAKAFATEVRTSRGISRATEIRTSRSICHGLTRNFTEKTEAETRKQNTSFRAGCVSDGINILFGKGPFGKLREKIEGGQK
jgi:hypothetical protein